MSRLGCPSSRHFESLFNGCMQLLYQLPEMSSNHLHVYLRIRFEELAWTISFLIFWMNAAIFECIVEDTIRSKFRCRSASKASNIMTLNASFNCVRNQNRSVTHELLFHLWKILRVARPCFSMMRPWSGHAPPQTPTFVAGVGEGSRLPPHMLYLPNIFWFNSIVHKSPIKRRQKPLVAPGMWDPPPPAHAWGV